MLLNAQNKMSPQPFFGGGRTPTELEPSEMAFWKQSGV